MSEIDNHKLMYHPERVAEWKKKGDCFPIYVEAGLTNSCNHRCIFCALDFVDFGKDFIDRDIMISNLKDMAEHGVKSIMFAGEGEPLLHKDIGLFTQKAKEYGMDVSITTNGVAFTKTKIEQCMPNLSWIRFSVDSGSPENYSQIHGTNPKDFRKVIKNIEQSVIFKYKNNLQSTIGVQFLMLPRSMKEGTKLAKICKDIGVDNLQIKPYSHHPKSNNDFIVDSKEYNKLEEDLLKFDSKDFKIIFRKATIQRIEEGNNYPECYGLPFFSLIDSKGNVIPCNLFYNDEEFTYGNLYNESFPKIWEGEKRKKILEKININECRKGCRLDVINRYLNRVQNPEPQDNFI